MRKIAISLCLSVASVCMAAPWSLDSCINYAISRNIDVRTALLNREKGDLSVTEAKDRFLPTLTASAAQNWDFGRGLTAENTYANRNTSSFYAGAQLSLPLFQGLSAIRRLRQAEASLGVLDLQVQAAKDEVTLGVMAYYLQALYNRELVAVAEEELRLSRTQLQRQKDLLEAGKVPEVDVLQAESQVAQGEVSLINAKNDYALALVDLQRALQLPEGEEFDILPVDGEAEAALIPSADEVYRNALERNSAIRAARANVSLSDHAIAVAETGYLPTLSLNAGLSSNYYRLSGIENPSFARQMRENFAKSIGFTLRVPIFDAFNTRNAVRQARTQRTMAELELQNRENELLRTIRQAHAQALGAEERYAAGIVAVNASKAALDAMTEKYTYGKANATEWEQTRSTYITTLSRQVQAKYEKILRTRILDFYNR